MIFRLMSKLFSLLDFILILAIVYVSICIWSYPHTDKYIKIRLLAMAGIPLYVFLTHPIRIFVSSKEVYYR